MRSVQYLVRPIAKTENPPCGKLTSSKSKLNRLALGCNFCSIPPSGAILTYVRIYFISTRFKIIALYVTTHKIETHPMWTQPSYRFLGQKNFGCGFPKGFSCIQTGAPNDTLADVSINALHALGSLNVDDVAIAGQFEYIFTDSMYVQDAPFHKMHHTSLAGSFLKN